MSIVTMPGFARAMCQSLGIDIEKEKVLAIDIAIRPLEAVTITTQRLLLTDEFEQVITVLRGIKWEPVESEKEQL